MIKTICDHCGNEFTSTNALGNGRHTLTLGVLGTGGRTKAYTFDTDPTCAGLVMNALATLFPNSVLAVDAHAGSGSGTGSGSGGGTGTGA